MKADRIAGGMTQRQLAKDCGVSVPVIARMENGDGGVKISTWVAVLRALGKLQNLDALIPAITMTPYDYAKAAQPKRQRAPRSDRKVKKSEWKWGD